MENETIEEFNKNYQALLLETAATENKAAKVKKTIAEKELYFENDYHALLRLKIEKELECLDLQKEILQKVKRGELGVNIRV